MQRSLEPLVEVRGLTKRYPSFVLEDVSFSVEAASITGFIGRNGAGKSTTLKCLEGAVRPDEGEILYFDEPFIGNEDIVKQQVGFELGGATFFCTKRVADVASVTRRFYRAWDDQVFDEYCDRFAIDQHKRIKELSQGMCVKFTLALALSHHSRLLILDEPTSGLDPASRDEVCDIFLTLAREEGVGILFSTHITSDLDKCADHIIYIENGRIKGAGEREAFKAAYRVASLEEARAMHARILGIRRSVSGDTALVPSEAGIGEAATLDDIMTHTRKEAQ